MSQVPTIIIKTQTATGEEVQQIEIDEATSGFLEQLSATATSVQDSGGGGDEVVTFMDGSLPQVGVGSAYVINPETGEIQLIQLNQPAIGEDDVEVVTVDANEILKSVGKVEIGGSIIQSLAPPASFGVTPRQLAPRVAAPGRSSAVPTAGTSFSGMGRLKSAPALLRNSRRIAANVDASITSSGYVDGGVLSTSLETPTASRISKANTRSKGNNRSATSKSKAKSQRSQRSGQGINLLTMVATDTERRYAPRVLVVNSGEDTAQQTFSILPSQIGNLVEQGQQRVVSEPTYYIYQDADGEQVAELIQDPSSVQETKNIIYQLDDNALFLDDDDLVGLAPVTTTPPKTRQPSKKRPKKAKATSDLASPQISEKKKANAELKCMEKGCPAVAYNVSELRKHLTIHHDMTFDSDSILFSSEAAFKEWREQYERERMVSFIYRGGTKKIAKDQAVTYMICHRSGHYKPTVVDGCPRKRKMKPQGSCKIGGYCTAGIKLLKNLETAEVRMDICHTHYGHPLDSEAIPHLRVNPTLRKIILKKFEEGMNFTDMLAYIHHNPDGLEGLRVVDRRAVRNIYDTWKNPVKRVKKLPVRKSGKNNPEAVGDLEEDILDEALNPPECQEAPDEDTAISNTGAIGKVENTANTPEGTSELQQPVEESLHQDGLEELENGQSQIEEDVESPEGDEQEKAPVLPLATQIDEFEQVGAGDEVEDNDNADPPLLIAIASVKSLKPLNSKVSPRKKNESEAERLIEPKRLKLDCDTKKSNSIPGPKTKSIPRSKKVKSSQKAPPYKLRPNRTVEVYKNKNFTTKSPTPKQKSGNFSKDKTENHQPSGNEAPMENLSHSPTRMESSVAPSYSDDEYVQIQISPELEAAIDKLHNHGEAGPSLLLYKRIGEINTKYGGFCRAFREDDFCLIIQTPVQRQIMQMFPKIVGIEILDGPRPNDTDLKLAFVMVLDDFREAIPVAWMVADTICTRVLNQFFRMLRYHCGELKVNYIMAPKNADIYKSWTNHFSNKPKMLQSEFCVKRDLRYMVNRHFPNDSSRRTVWNIIENMISEKHMSNLETLKTTLTKTLKQYPPNGTNFLRKLEKDWLSRIEEWALAHRVATDVNLQFVAESFSKLRKFVSFKGTKKLNQSVDHILKIGYDKCFLRSKRMFKGDQKFSNMLEKVDSSHQAARETLSSITLTEYENENRWKIETDLDDNTAEVFYLQSPCDCKIVCKICKICIHQYMCSCDAFSKEQMMCAHIHKVHCVRNNISDEDDPSAEPEADESSPNDLVEGEPIPETNNEDMLSIVNKSELGALCEGTEITINVNESDMEGLNISEVLQAAAGLFKGEHGQELPKIVSITEVGSQKILYDASGPIVFHLEAE